MFIFSWSLKFASISSTTSIFYYKFIVVIGMVIDVTGIHIEKKM